MCVRPINRSKKKNPVIIKELRHVESWIISNVFNV